jgi:AcrR family transcriptional regulator
MARPRELDEQVVLDAPMQCFWVRGYEATSVRDLADRMGITSASLNNAFGDKRALYRLVLDRYVRLGLKSCSDAFADDVPPMRALERYFDATISEALNDRQRKGCPIVNTSLRSRRMTPTSGTLLRWSLSGSKNTCAIVLRPGNWRERFPIDSLPMILVGCCSVHFWAFAS